MNSFNKNFVIERHFSHSLIDNHLTISFYKISNQPQFFVLFKDWKLILDNHSYQSK